ncbi:MAG: 16S rRNA (cytidine(1402)-2'-O)-methyltransferase [Balneolales bacterium]|nr:16S rRNA (cytidine(1402)-2'-O)-methyltransferase [Balneolales bacterium]
MNQSENILEAGTLYITGTPIGNKSDLSPRALEVLTHADVIACEDTRTSGSFLRSMGILTPMLAYHQHNEHQKTSDIIRRLQSGSTIALISDAGTPAISDPGFLLVRAAHQQGVPVIPIPGPSSGIVALSASGLPSDRFLFEGFLPAKKGRKTKISEIAESDCTVIMFESPHRIIRLLTEFEQVCNDERLCCIGRELTKMYEEIVRGSIHDVLQKMKEKPKVKGEFVFILAGKNYQESTS